MAARAHRIDPMIALFLLAIVGPVLIGLAFSALYSLGGIGLLSSGWTLKYWRAALTHTETWVALGYSAYIALVSVAVSAALALTVVVMLGERVRRGGLGYLLYVPLAIPATVAGLLSFEIFGNAGLLSRIAHALGLTSVPADFPNLLFDRAGFGIILTHLAMITPFLVIFFDRLGRSEHLDALNQLAATLGASRTQNLCRVTVPVMLRRAAPTLSLYGIFLLSAFEVPLLIGAQYPPMISVLIQRRFGLFDIATKPEAYALATLYGIVILAGLLIAFRRRDASGRRGAEAYP